MIDGLSLYAFPSCPYCRRVLRALEALDVEVELRDIHRDPERRRELVEATGRSTVPVLRIEDGDGVRWLPESRDIVAYLHGRFGDGAPPPSLWARYDGVLRLVMWALLLAGAVFSDAHDALWLSACALGAARAFSTARRCGGVYSWGIGAVFALGALSIGLNMAGLPSPPWWYAAYALVAALGGLALWQRFVQKRR